MIKQSIKQALNMFRENRLVSLISVLGTALSIAMIMVVVLVFQINAASYYPEENRDRMLYIEGGTEVKSGTNNWSRGNMSAEAVRECFYSLKTPEVASAWIDYSNPLSIPGKKMYKAYSVKYTDSFFWNIYSFRFIEGKPFTDADFHSAISHAVVSEKVAKILYGTSQVVGKTVIVDRMPYTICGVVKDVSRAADTAWSEVWVPYTTNKVFLNHSFMEGMNGVFNMCLLAKNAGDFEAIRQEILKQTAAYNSTKKNNTISFLENPITRFDKAIGSEGQNKIELKDYLAETGGLLLFLLLVPALNLMGVTQSAIQKRRSEMGVRKAFGATYGILIRQILYENSLITLLGGLVGLLLSFLLLPVCKDFLLGKSDTLLNADMLFRPGVFALALLFSLLLNLLSAGIPALRIARQQISTALKGDDK